MHHILGTVTRVLFRFLFLQTRVFIANALRFSKSENKIYCMSVRKDKHSPVTEGFHTEEQSSHPASIAGSVLVFSPSLLMLLIKDFCVRNPYGLKPKKLPCVTSRCSIYTFKNFTLFRMFFLKQGSVLNLKNCLRYLYIFVTKIILCTIENAVVILTYLLYKLEAYHFLD
jgi:hypothetical protein